MSQNEKEPSDRHTYSSVFFSKEALEFYLKALTFYESLLQENLNSFKADSDLKSILSEEVIDSLPISEELLKTQHMQEWFIETLKKTRPWGFEHNVSHGTIRFLKSVCRLYMKHLQVQRDSIAANPRMATQVLSSVDQKLASLQEKFSGGVFENATPMPLLVDEIPNAQGAKATQPSLQVIEPIHKPPPLVLDSIPILDSTLRKRCLDLFDTFRKNTQLDRLDTVVSEATRILEDRLRTLSDAPEDCSGIDLASFAFSGSSPRLRVSNVEAEQQAAHHLFRGAFGYMRNISHHRLLGELQPERVLQIVAYVDYLIHIAETAEKFRSPQPAPGS